MIELAFEDDALRQLLKSPALRQIGLVKHSPLLWLNTPRLLQTKFEKSVVALADINAHTKNLIKAFVASEPRKQAHIRATIRKHLLYVLIVMLDVT